MSRQQGKRKPRREHLDVRTDPHGKMAPYQITKLMARCDKFPSIAHPIAWLIKVFHREARMIFPMGIAVTNAEPGDEVMMKLVGDQKTLVKGYASEPILVGQYLRFARHQDNLSYREYGKAGKKWKGILRGI